MAKLVFDVDDSTLQNVESILGSIGLDLEIAFNIYLKKIILEKGLPFSVKQTTVSHEEPFHTEDNTRRNNTGITEIMITEVWNTFKKFRVGVDDVLTLREVIAKKTGMNPGSAGIYLNILLNLSKGQINKRAMKPSDFEFFLRKFQQELGAEQFRKALNSVKVSIPYWRSNIPTFADSMEELLRKLS